MLLIDSFKAPIKEDYLLGFEMSSAVANHKYHNLKRVIYHWKQIQYIEVEARVYDIIDEQGVRFSRV